MQAVKGKTVNQVFSHNPRIPDRLLFPKDNNIMKNCDEAIAEIENSNIWTTDGKLVSLSK